MRHAAGAGGIEEHAVRRVRYVEVGRAGRVVGQVDVLEVRQVAGAHVTEALGMEAARLAALRVGQVWRAAGRGERHGVGVVMMMHDGGHEGSGVFLPGVVLLQRVDVGPGASRGGWFGAGGARGRDQSSDIVGLGDAVQSLVAVEVRMNIVEVRTVENCSSAESVVLLGCEERRRHLDGRRNFGRVIWLSP